MVAHQCDLAILKVSDESFFSGAKPILIRRLSDTRDLVRYYVHGEKITDRQQVVVLVKVLADELNVGYHE